MFAKTIRRVYHLPCERVQQLQLVSSVPTPSKNLQRAISGSRRWRWLKFPLIVRSGNEIYGICLDSAAVALMSPTTTTGCSGEYGTTIHTIHASRVYQNASSSCVEIVAIRANVLNLHTDTRQRTVGQFWVNVVKLTKKYF